MTYAYVIILHGDVAYLTCRGQRMSPKKCYIHLCKQIWLLSKDDYWKLRGGGVFQRIICKFVSFTDIATVCICTLFLIQKHLNVSLSGTTRVFPAELGNFDVSELCRKAPRSCDWGLFSESRKSRGTNINFVCYGGIFPSTLIMLTCQTLLAVTSWSHHHKLIYRIDKLSM